jgi:hypothetical protein
VSPICYRQSFLTIAIDGGHHGIWLGNAKGQGRNAFGVDGTTQASAPGIGRGFPFEDPSRIRDNWTGRGLLATAHQNTQ